MALKIVVVHLNLGFEKEDELSKKILKYIKGRNPNDVIFLSTRSEYLDKSEFAEFYGFPESCFYPSFAGELSKASKLPIDYFKGHNVEVIGYVFSPGGFTKCVNNAERDIQQRWPAKVTIVQDLVKLATI
jgi:hypothetical protein